MTGPKTQQPCIFCVAAAATDDDELLVVYRSDEALVMLNRYPYANGHLMVAPRAHLARLDESSDSTLLPLIRLTAEAQRILSDTYHPNGFNIGMNLGEAAGAGIADHYHMHVVPRWTGDSNFMTVTAQTRLVPETLEQTFTKLRPQFSRLEGVTS
ncbi:MAG TPA: HIT domain-containing protein [Thermoanaerobaculia bacterium]|nr:HIT domain-containing protein [Thermoanaerobaculia bacterium]